MKKPIYLIIGLIVTFILITTLIFTQQIKQDNQVLKIYNWANYIGNNTIANFEKEFNCKVIYDHYASNEEMIAKIRSGSKYDITFPTDYALKIMRKSDMLVPLDHSKLSNFKNIDSKFLNLSDDRNNIYSIPYHWGNCGIAYNSKKLAKPSSSKVLWDKKYKKRIAIPEDPRFVIGMILQQLGYSVNTTNKKELDKAKELMMSLKDNILSFSAFNEKMLTSGEIDLVYGYSSGLLQFEASGKSNLKYIIPSEGTILWFDSMCIPKTSENIELAHKFINYILRPEVIAKISNEIFAANANKASTPLLKKELLNNHAIYPTKDVLAKSEFVHDLGKDNDLYMNLWQSVKEN